MPRASCEICPSDNELGRHWRGLAGSTIAASVGAIGLTVYTNGAFVPELVARAGYSREQLSLATLILSIVVAVAMPLVGQAIDRWGAVKVIVASVVGEVIGFALLAVSPSGFGWYAAALLAFGILGVGTTPPSYTRVVAERFNRGRGVALGLMVSGLGVTAILAPIVMTWIIAAFGWRGGYGWLSALVLVMGGTGIRLIRIDRVNPSLKRADTSDLGDWSAIRRPLYWWVLLSFAAPSFFSAGYLLYMISFLLERGYTAAQAAEVQAFVGVAIIAGRILSGLAMDRMFAPRVAAISFAISALGTAMLRAHSLPSLSLAALGIGVTFGAELDMLALVISRYFGLDSFGRLFSLAYGLIIVASGASPVMIAWLSRGSDYTTAIEVSSVGMSAAAVLVWLLPAFQASQLPSSHRQH
jgi:predicted MFS family arabinose efflux permease